MSRRPVSLDRLNEAERRVLRLLAEGHTAKSIAVAINSTPAAVNERLREARRKTGLSSSREIARLVRSQESRHEQIGVAAARRSVAALAEPAAETWRPQTEVVGMFALLVVAATGAAALLSQAPVSDKQIDPLLGAPLPKLADPRDLHARVRAEKRDPSWAPRMESALRKRLVRIPLIGIDGNVLRVTCATTICEMAGTLIAPESKREREDQNSSFNTAIRDLQTSPLPEDLSKIGLKSEAATFMGGKGKPDRTVFLVYYLRAPTTSAVATHR
jgi:DNA-binding CsgD family transcriptional regulator